MEEYLNLILVRNEKIKLRKIDGKYYFFIFMDLMFDFFVRKFYGDY